MEDRLKKQLDFSLEIDKEKNIFRQTHLSGHGRNENDAEHAWHMALMAYLLREWANEEVDIAKVRKRGRKPRKRESSPCCRRIRKRNSRRCLMSSKRMRRQKPDMRMPWTIFSRFF